jgi:hypothetical protein
MYLLRCDRGDIRRTSYKLALLLSIHQSLARLRDTDNTPVRWQAGRRQRNAENRCSHQNLINQRTVGVT